MPLQSHRGCSSCTLRATSFNTSSSCASEATRSSTSDLKSSPSPAFSLIDGVLPQMERHPPIITPPQREIREDPIGGGPTTALLGPQPIKVGYLLQVRLCFQENLEPQFFGRSTFQKTALAGEEPRGVPHQEDAAARRVLHYADQLPALARSLVDRLLQGRLRSAALAGV